MNSRESTKVLGSVGMVVLLVLSVFAGGIAFTDTASAASTPYVDILGDDTPPASQNVSYNIALNESDNVTNLISWSVEGGNGTASLYTVSDAGTGTITYAAIQNASWSNGGTYNITATVETIDGTQATDTLPVTVQSQNDAPNPSLSRYYWANDTDSDGVVDLNELVKTSDNLVVDKSTIYVAYNISDNDDPTWTFEQTDTAAAQNATISAFSGPLYEIDIPDVGSNYYGFTLNVTDSYGSTGSDTIYIDTSDESPPTVDLSTGGIGGGISFLTPGKYTYTLGDVGIWDTGDRYSFSQASDEGRIVNYTWVLENRSSGQTQDFYGPTFSYEFEEPKDYNFTLTVTDDNGTSASGTVELYDTTDGPAANAGGPYSVELGNNVTFDGSSSVGNITSYTWTIPDWNGDGQDEIWTGISPMISPTSTGTYNITLEVVDDTGATDTSNSTLDVTPGVNDAPVADAGSDFNSSNYNFDLNGQNSSDPENDSLNYSWVVTSKPNGAVVNITDSTSSVTDVSVDTNGVYTFELTADDGELADTDSVSVTVEVPNNPPVVTASADLSTVEVGDIASLFANVSDPDGHAISNVDGMPIWTVVNKPVGSSVTFPDPYLFDAASSFDAAGNYTLRATVEDQYGETTNDTIVIEVIEPLTETSTETSTESSTETSDSVFLGGDGGGSGDGGHSLFWQIFFSLIFVGIPVIGMYTIYRYVRDKGGELQIIQDIQKWGEKR